MATPCRWRWCKVPPQHRAAAAATVPTLCPIRRALDTSPASPSSSPAAHPCVRLPHQRHNDALAFMAVRAVGGAPRAHLRSECGVRAAQRSQRVVHARLPHVACMQGRAQLSVAHSSQHHGCARLCFSNCYCVGSLLGRAPELCVRHAHVTSPLPKREPANLHTVAQLIIEPVAQKSSGPTKKKRQPYMAGGPKIPETSCRWFNSFALVQSLKFRRNGCSIIIMASKRGWFNLLNAKWQWFNSLSGRRVMVQSLDGSTFSGATVADS
jgi:hypothetical protein